MDVELPLVLGGRPGDLGVLGAARQRLALVALRRAELQHGARQVPVRQNLQNGLSVTGEGYEGSTRETYTAKKKNKDLSFFLGVSIDKENDEYEKKTRDAP